MPRLKTYIAESGFYELAIATTSMERAAQALGISPGEFSRGFAHQGGDTEAIRSTQTQPNVVLKRPIGTKGPFRQDAKLPKVKATNRSKKAPQAIDKRAIEQALAELTKAEGAHRRRAAILQEKLRTSQAQADEEDEAWQTEQKRLRAALAAAKRRR